MADAFLAQEHVHAAGCGDAAPSAMTAMSAMRLNLPDEAGLSAVGFAVVEAMWMRA